MLKCAPRTSVARSLHAIGIDTGRPSRARSEYAATAVAPSALRSQSTNTRPLRCALLAVAMNTSGWSSTSRRASAPAKRFASSKSWRRSSGTTKCSPLPPVVFRNHASSSRSSSARTCPAAARNAGQSTDGSGSRSSTRRSGRSMRGTRDCHACSSIAPFWTAAITSRSVAQQQVRRIVRRARRRAARIAGVLLEETRAEVAARTFHQRERPVGDLRHQHVRDGGVVAREVDLGRAGCSRQRAIGVADAHAGDACRLRRVAAETCAGASGAGAAAFAVRCAPPSRSMRPLSRSMRRP